MHSLNLVVEPTFPLLAPKLGLIQFLPSGGHMHATHQVPEVVETRWSICRSLN